jgi:ribose 1,5-bisphosphate isomerase
MKSGEQAWFAQVLQDIKSLRIQGAEHVARAAVEALARLVKERGSLAVTKEAEQLRQARTTEPMLRNAIDYFLKNATAKNADIVRDRIISGFDEGDRRIAEYAAGLIKANGTYVTHCHSSTVIAAFRLAKEQGISFTVHNTETRPLFQGRKTSQELAALGIPVTHYVDSAARVALKACDAVFLGADALLVDGKVVNKIGSEMVAELAHSRSIPVYVLAHSWKFDPASAKGFKEKIETRSPAEVWADAPPGIVVENLAFELILPRYVTAVITEQGIRDPFTAVKEIQSRRTWLFPTEKCS